MSAGYPEADTWSEDHPICPGCGHEFDTDEGNYYPQHSLDDTFEDEECPGCGLKLVINVELKPRWTIEHPHICQVREHHVPLILEKWDTHECMDCKQPLTCECTLHDHCTHNLKTMEEVMS